MDEQSRRTAERFGLVSRCEKLEQDLLSVDGVTEVIFDVNGFYDNLNQVIFLTKYNLDPGREDYFPARKQLLSEVIKAARENGLKRTGDRIEDYGEHFYFVFSCGREWSKEEQAADGRNSSLRLNEIQPQGPHHATSLNDQILSAISRVMEHPTQQSEHLKKQAPDR